MFLFKGLGILVRKNTSGLQRRVLEHVFVVSEELTAYYVEDWNCITVKRFRRFGDTQLFTKMKLKALHYVIFGKVTRF
jgi:hypothetical protein